MKKLSYLFLLIPFAIGGCTPAKSVQCENMICTQEFRSVTVKFKDASGNAVAVKDFKSVNNRTGKEITSESSQNNWGGYTVVSDADTKTLSEKGDAIVVTATHPATNKRVSAEFVVSGGACACHINKISGPEEITF